MNMWCRIITFCLLVCLVLFIVLSCIHGRPVFYLFFHRCCEEDIENDQVIFENFGNNFLRERLVGEDGIIVSDNESFVSSEEVEDVIALMRAKFNVHDPKTRINVTVFETQPVNFTGDGKDASQMENEDVTKDSESKEVVTLMRAKFNVHDPKTRINVTVFEIQPVNFTGDAKDATEIENEKVTKYSESEEVVTERIEIDHTPIDVSSDSEEAVTPESELSSENNVLSELDSDESVEVTTERTERRVAIPFRNTDIIR